MNIKDEKIDVWVWDHGARFSNYREKYWEFNQRSEIHLYIRTCTNFGTDNGHVWNAQKTVCVAQSNLHKFIILFIFLFLLLGFDVLKRTIILTQL